MSMSYSPLARPRRGPRALAMAAVMALAACATVDRAPATPLPDAQGPAPAIVDLSAARRCMDNLLLDQGPRDLALRVEEIADPAPRGGAAVRDMLVSSLSDMTQRSRAIRIVQASQAEPPGAGSAQYLLRGSVSLQDKVGGSGAAVLGLDLTLLTIGDMSVVPGTASRSTAAWFERGAGQNGRVEIGKFGRLFSVPTASNDGRALAQRALADVASIELVGRLARVPYWNCFGASTAEPKIAAEVQDWYDAMAARPVEIIGYFQQQLRLRHLYDGAVDGVVNPQLKEAVARYRGVLGLSPEPKLSLDFFQAYLAADHHALEGRAALVAVAQVAPVVATVAAPASASETQLTLRVAAANASQRFARGQAVQLTIQPNRNAHVYCFHQDENRKITRFFPNRFQTNSQVPSAVGLKLPGSMNFEIAMNARGMPETVACFATETDVLARLPADLNSGDFAVLPVASLDQVRSAFLKVAGRALAEDSFQIRGR
jgi:Domain of unknown function (DUF4384)